jgi:hypothetical protein
MPNGMPAAGPVAADDAAVKATGTDDVTDK